MEYLRKAQHLRRCFHRSAHRQGSSLRSQPCPIKSKSPTGIVAHATGRHFPRGMQPHADDLLRGLSHTQPGYISLVECNPMPATSTGIVAHATGRHEISRVECNPMPTTSMGIVAHATGRHEMSRVAYNQATRDLPHAFLRCGYTGYRSYCQ